MSDSTKLPEPTADELRELTNPDARQDMTIAEWRERCAIRIADGHVRHYLLAAAWLLSCIEDRGDVGGWVLDEGTFAGMRVDVVEIAKMIQLEHMRRYEP